MKKHQSQSNKNAQRNNGSGKRLTGSYKITDHNLVTTRQKKFTKLFIKQIKQIK